MYFVVAFGTLVGILITGAIIINESTSEYQHYIIFCGICSIAAAMCFIILRFFCVGLKIVRF